MRQTPPCKYLRTKKMFIPALTADGPTGEDEFADSPHCWCNRTLTEVGPDDNPVGDQVCKSARSCFEE
jgi:hypothetical protein